MTGKSAADTWVADTWVAGVDGCPGGWLVAFMRAAAREVRVRIVPQFAQVLAAAESAAVIAIDIPIGLPARAGWGGRAPERLVRPLLGARQSSVFSVPSRAALATADYRQACAVALATSDPPRKISKQLFMIAPKIREVDQSLRMDPQASDRVFEVHPELAFWRLNASRALDEPKKIKGRCNDRGLAVRRRLLIAAGFPESMVHADPPKGAGEDDLLDALACAAIAQRIAEGRARPFPDPPERDEHGLRIAIWA
jgi:predicted RNase H-like nuclease